MARILLCLCYWEILLGCVSLNAAQNSDIIPPDTTLILMIKEGLACFDMAVAIPQLATLTGVYSDIFNFFLTHYIVSLRSRSRRTSAQLSQVNLYFVAVVNTISFEAFLSLISTLFLLSKRVNHFHIKFSFTSTNRMA